MLLVLVLRPVIGQPLHLVSEFRYLGIFIVSSRSFKCSLAYARRSFYTAVNGLFGKLLNLASEGVILELVRTKCRVAWGKTPSRGKTPTHDIRGTGRNPVKCLLTISVGEWPEFVYIFGTTRQS